MGPSGSLNSLDFVVVFSRHSIKFPKHGCLVLLQVPQSISSGLQMLFQKDIDLP